MGDKLYLSYETQPKLSNNFRADEKFFVGSEKSHKFRVLQKVSLAKAVRLNLYFSNNFRADEKFFVGLEKSHKFRVLQKVSLAKAVRLNLNYLIISELTRNFLSV